MRVRIKICGLTRVDDALAAAAAGADAVGLVFTDRSRREVAPAVAAQIVAALPPFVCAVGLFVDATSDWVATVLDQVPLALLQFSGSETNAECAAHGAPFIKAVRVDGPVDGAALAAAYPQARGLLLDAAVEGHAGGTGRSFDWRWFPKDPVRPWILAGGLTVDNVGTAIRALTPFAVDLSTGVEVAPGIKDHALMRAFCSAVRGAEHGQAG